MARRFLHHKNGFKKSSTCFFPAQRPGQEALGDDLMVQTTIDLEDEKIPEGVKAGSGPARFGEGAD